MGLITSYKIFQDSVVFVVSCKHYLDTRVEACQATWGEELSRAGVEVFYVIGDPNQLTEFIVNGNLLFVKCNDTYACLPAKTRLACKFFTTRYTDKKYMFKCDDDTYINSYNFLHFDKEDTDYTGIAVHSYYASGGGGYFLSQKSAKIIASSDLDEGAEDMLVGKRLEDAGIKFLHDAKHFDGWRAGYTSKTNSERTRLTNLDNIKNKVGNHLLRIGHREMYKLHRVVHQTSRQTTTSEFKRVCQLHFENIKHIADIVPDINNVFFYWENPPSAKKLKLIQDSVHSTAFFNPERPIFMVSNTLTGADFDIKRFKNVKVVKWNNDIFDCLPNSEVAERLYAPAHPRVRCNLFRLLFMYNYGGSYCDTDNIAIRPYPSPDELKNIICRTYDPHVCQYSNLTPDDCVTGSFRETRGHDDIPMFTRCDGWVNFEPGCDILWQILTFDKFQEADVPLHMTHEYSWQRMALDVLKTNKSRIGKDVNFLLTLFYLYESHVAHCSHWDRCTMGGELCDIWPGEINASDWGNQRFSYTEAMSFHALVLEKFKYACHLWLQDKELVDEYDELPNLDLNKKYLLSTWFYYILQTQVLVNNSAPSCKLGF